MVACFILVFVHFTVPKLSSQVVFGDIRLCPTQEAIPWKKILVPISGRWQQKYVFYFHRKNPILTHIFSKELKSPTSNTNTISVCLDWTLSTLNAMHILSFFSSCSCTKSWIDLSFPWFGTPTVFVSPVLIDTGVPWNIRSTGMIVLWIVSG